MKWLPAKNACMCDVFHKLDCFSSLLSYLHPNISLMKRITVNKSLFLSVFHLYISGSVAVFLLPFPPALCSIPRYYCGYFCGLLPLDMRSGNFSPTGTFMQRWLVAYKQENLAEKNWQKTRLDNRKISWKKAECIFHSYLVHFWNNNTS